MAKNPGRISRLLVSALALVLLTGSFTAIAQSAIADFTPPPSDPLYATCAAPGSDEFAGSSLNTGLWTQINGPVSHTVTGGDLVLPTVAANSAQAPIIGQPVPAGTDWEVTTQVTVTPTANFQQAGLALWENSGKWVILDVYHSGQRRLQLNNSGSSSFIPVPPGEGPTYWLRLTRSGNTLTGAYSADAGQSWTQLGGNVSMTTFTPTHVGLTAFRGASSGAPSINAAFDWFRISPTPAQLAACDGPLYEYCAAPGSDEFAGSSLNTGLWTQINGPVGHTVTGGDLVLPTAKVNSAQAPIVAQPVPAGTAWEVTTKVTINPTGSFQQAGLMLWQNSSKWVSLNAYHSSGQQRLQLNNSGSSSFILVPGGQGPTFWFRLARNGSSITGSYSADAGQTWTQLGGNVSLSGFTPTHIGLTALRGATSSAPSIDAHFDWFRISPTPAQLAACGYGGSGGDDDYDLVRDRWRAMLTGEGVPTGQEPYASALAAIDAAAWQHWSTLSAPPTTELWADLDTSSHDAALQAFRRLRAMATAWATPGSAYAGNAALLADTIEATDRLTALRYYDGMPKNSTYWWQEQIGFPLELNAISALLYDELSPTQLGAYMDAVEHHTPSVNLSGANRVWKATVVAQRGVLVKSSAKLGAARNGLSPVFDLVTSGDGFYADGSFVQHSYYPYTGGYGTSLLLNLSHVLHLLHGSPWEVTDPDLANVYGWVTDSFDPVMFEGAMMDSVRGREMSREANPDYRAGANTLRGILVLAESAPTGIGTELRRIASRHLAAGSHDFFWNSAPLAELALGEAALGLTPAAALEGVYAFNGMDRAVHHSGEHAFGVAMSSSRIAGYEAIGSENHRSWYTADGMTYLYSDDADQYSDDYWPTVNRYRLAGTTVDTMTKTSTAGANTRSASHFAGTAAGSGGTAGVTGMQLDAFGTTLLANKAWFFFDDEVVALGSGITATGQSGNGWNGQTRRVETVLDNRKVTAGHTLRVDGTIVGTTPGQVQTHTSVDWLHLDGPDGRIGYVLPEPATVRTVRESRSGSWSTINPRYGSTTTHTRAYATAWLDHGTNPSNAGYAYVVLPGATQSQTSAYAATPDILVLANSTAVAAVEETTIGAMAASFWSPTGATVQRGGQNWLTSNRAALVVVEHIGGRLLVTVVDPTQQQTGSITLQLAVPTSGVVSASPGVTVTQNSPSTVIQVNVTGAKGKAFSVELDLP